MCARPGTTRNPRAKIFKGQYSTLKLAVRPVRESPTMMLGRYTVSDCSPMRDCTSRSASHFERSYVLRKL